ncbi:MAG: LacI family DNA-binding transcriptional regulator [Bacteroidales bacterium]|nr:LacI family DNA-binding transcriptional regulator [Bacteroidales bacterium]
MVKGEKEVTIYDVARTLNVSPSTVSRALKNNPNIREETKKRIVMVAGEMGYRHNKFASNLRQKRTNTIGVVVPRLNSNFMASAISGTEKITSENGYGLIITQSQESWKKEMICISTLFNSRVDGLLVSLANDTENLNHFNILFKKDIPVIFFDRVPDCEDCMGVVIDNFKAAYEMTLHLIQQGCKKIMHLGGNMLRNVYAERLRGYKQALDENGIEYRHDLVRIGDMSTKAGIDLARNIIRMKHRPDAIFTSNDTSAVAAIVELKKAGIDIPGDIAVAGFNNEPVCQFVSPNLTTVDYPAKKMGEIAVNLLLERLNNPANTTSRTIVLKHELVIRESTMKKSIKIRNK